MRHTSFVTMIIGLAIVCSAATVFPASTKISGRGSATTPVGSTDTLGIIQGGVDKKVTIGNLGAPIAISSAGIPFIKASSGSMGDNCAITGLSALPRTQSNGAYIYLPTNAIEAGSAAGWYWFVASSTTAGTCYNSTYTSGLPASGTATAFATTGPGAFTGATGAVTSVSITLPANSMGANGRIDTLYAWNGTSSGSNKIIVATFGGNTMASITAASGTSGLVHGYAQNMNSASLQLYGHMASSTVSTLGLAATAYGTIATTSAVTLTYTLNAALATDNITLEHYWVEARYKD